MCEYDVISTPNKFNLSIPCGIDIVAIHYEQTWKCIFLLHCSQVLSSNLYNYCYFSVLFVKTTLLKYTFCTCHICLDVICSHNRDIHNHNVYVFMIFVPHFTFPTAVKLRATINLLYSCQPVVLHPKKCFILSGLLRTSVLCYSPFLYQTRTTAHNGTKPEASHIVWSAIWFVRNN